MEQKRIPLIQYFRMLLDILPKINEFGMSVRRRIFMLLTLFTISIVFCILFILTITGTLTSGVRETEKDIDQELQYLSQDIKQQYDQASAYSVAFSEELSGSIERELAVKGLSVSDLKKHPEVLEPIIHSEYDKTLLALQKSNCSGAFIILDATVNPGLEGSEHSKSGLYIKNMEPNILHANSSYFLILRGFSSIGRQNSIPLHSQWRMEFDVSDAAYFYKPIKAAKEKNLPLSRLYYWSPAIKLPDSTEDIMLCSAPLIDSKGNVFGVCGFEISSMLFKLSHIPQNDVYERLICILGPGSEQELSISKAFLSGSYSIRSMKEKQQILSIRKDKPFSSYRQEDGTLFSGLHQSISLYPKGAAFEKENWTVALLMPDKDINSSVIKMNLRLILLFLALLIIGITTSYILSKKFLTFLSENQKHQQKKISTEENPADRGNDVFNEFINNIKLLSPAERAVFDLYVQGHTAKEITEILCLSINTIKTHSKRIYMKLNVASREELLVYVNMLKEAGREIN